MVTTGAKAAPSFSVPSAPETGTLHLEITTSPPTPNKSLFSHLKSWLSTRAPSPNAYQPGSKFTVTATGYAPSPYQTDSTPCITASGTRVRRGTVAANFLPFGTILDIQGERYIVEDRTNPRYRNRLDIFFIHTSDALEFGIKPLEITIIGYGQPGQSLAAVAVSAEDQITALKSEDISPAKSNVTVADRAIGQFVFLRRIAAGLIGTRSPDELNRYDIDCLTSEH